MCCTYLLDATDPLFVEIGTAFIKEQLKGALIYIPMPVHMKSVGSYMYA